MPLRQKDQLAGPSKHLSTKSLTTLTNWGNRGDIEEFDKPTEATRKVERMEGTNVNKNGRNLGNKYEKVVASS